MLLIAKLLACRATCIKLQVGCVLTNSYGHIIGTGFNGNARGLPHCVDSPCPGAKAPAGADLCEAIHAEQNALMQCRDVHTIDKCFVTHAPCQRCTKQLLNTSCKTIIFGNNDHVQPQAQELWKRAGRNWIHYGQTNPMP